MDTKLFIAPDSNNTMLDVGLGRKHTITSSGWPFVSAVLSQMAHLVASITLDSARSYVMQSAFLTQGVVFSIPIVFSWGGSISLEGFLSSVLLWLVIIVAVVGVGVTVRLRIHQDRASSDKVPVANFTLQSSVQLLRENTDSVCLNQRIRVNSAFRTFEVDSLFSGVTISNPEASQRNLAVISQLLSLEFSNLSMSLLEFSFQIVKILLYDHPTFSKRDLLFCLLCAECGRERVYLGDLKFPQFAPREIPDLSYESFLLSQMFEVGQK
ncbi:hypothetical protein Tco_0927857 [Tanacetum coccineum]